MQSADAPISPLLSSTALPLFNVSNFCQQYVEIVSDKGVSVMEILPIDNRCRDEADWRICASDSRVRPVHIFSRVSWYERLFEPLPLLCRHPPRWNELDSGWKRRRNVLECPLQLDKFLRPCLDWSQGMFCLWQLCAIHCWWRSVCIWFPHRKLSSRSTTSEVEREKRLKSSTAVFVRLFRLAYTTMMLSHRHLHR